jgi:uncharacterized protein (TIGR02594 family)
MVNRRRFIASLTAIVAARGLGGRLLSQEQPSSPPSEIGVKPDYDGPLPPLGVLGQEKPTTAQEKIAGDILAAAPSGPTPFDVASFFIDIGDGKYTSTWKPYIEGWPVRWNPLIVRFFRETRTNPDHFDDTPWCAAFVNWCYQRANSNVATNSPSSGSFRCFGSETRHPRPGDIVVFKTLGAEDNCIGQGHVGFFVRDLGNKIEVLGGNQVMGRQHHMICSQAIEKKGHRLTLHSYRTEMQLHRSG